jgi:hypothetical protein
MQTIIHDKFIDMFQPQLAWIAAKKEVDVRFDIEMMLCLNVLYKGAKWN